MGVELPFSMSSHPYGDLWDHFLCWGWDYLHTLRYLISKTPFLSFSGVCLLSMVPKMLKKIHLKIPAAKSVSGDHDPVTEGDPQTSLWADPWRKCSPSSSSILERRRSKTFFIVCRDWTGTFDSSAWMSNVLVSFLVSQIGLDFTPWCAPTQQDRDDQMSVFVRQLDIAKELDLPVWVHDYKPFNRRWLGWFILYLEE